MARRLPARDRFGRFLPRSRSHRRNEPDPARRRRYRRNEPDPEPARARSRRRRYYRRNPAMRGLPGVIMGGLTHGVAVLAGDGLSGSIAAQLVKPKPGTELTDAAQAMRAAVKAGAGVALGLVAEMVGLRQWAQSVTAGAFAGALRPFIVKANVPLLSAGLSDYPQIGAYVFEQPAALPGPAPALGDTTQDVDIYGTSSLVM